MVEEATSAAAPAAPIASAAPAAPKGGRALDVIRRFKAEHNVDRVIVGLSNGKDAAATLDLCVQHFREVRAYFMYLVPGLSFQEKYLSYHERRYGIKVLRVPSFNLSYMYRHSVFRHPTKAATKIRVVTMRDTDNYVRKQTGLEWIATGERCRDSLERNAQIKRVNGINAQRRRFWPIGFWSDGHVHAYLKQRGIALSAEYSTDLKLSFGSLWYRELKAVRDRFPADYERIVKFFPLVPAQMKRYEDRERIEKREQAARDVAERAKRRSERKQRAAERRQAGERQRKPAERKEEAQK